MPPELDLAAPPVSMPASPAPTAAASPAEANALRPLDTFTRRHLGSTGKDVAAMPDAGDTLIGPRGLRLSGGQRQRLATARALVHGPELIVLDDLSSAVDVETELRLWENLAAAGLTVIAVSHRVSGVPP